MTGQDLANVLALLNVPGDVALELDWYGKSAISLEARFPVSSSANDPAGSFAIKAANFREAVSAGNRAKLAASCQGSTSSRASAERTLTVIPLLSSLIGANKKPSNSDGRGETEAVRVISTTKFCRLCPLSNSRLRPASRQKL